MSKACVSMWRANSAQLLESSNASRPCAVRHVQLRAIFITNRTCSCQRWARSFSRMIERKRDRSEAKRARSLIATSFSCSSNSLFRERVSPCAFYSSSLTVYYSTHELSFRCVLYIRSNSCHNRLPRTHEDSGTSFVVMLCLQLETSVSRILWPAVRSERRGESEKEVCWYTYRHTVYHYYRSRVISLTKCKEITIHFSYRIKEFRGTKVSVN